MSSSSSKHIVAGARGSAVQTLGESLSDKRPLQCHVSGVWESPECGGFRPAGGHTLPAELHLTVVRYLPAVFSVTGVHCLTNQGNDLGAHSVGRIGLYH